MLAHDKHSLRLVLRPFDRKEPRVHFTDIDELDRDDLLILARIPDLVEVEVVVSAPLPHGLDAWIDQLLETLPGVPRRIILRG